MKRLTRAAVAFLAAVCTMFVSAGALVLSSGQAQAADNTCVVDQSTIAQCFPDPALAQAVASNLGTHTTTSSILTSADVQYTTSLGVNGAASSLRGIGHLTNLTFLAIFKGTVSDLSPLKDLNQLNGLDVYENPVSNLSPLTGLTNLTWLELTSDQISDLSPLKNLIKTNEFLHLDLSNQYVAMPSVDGSNGVSISTAKNIDGTYLKPNSLSPASGTYDANTGKASWNNLANGNSASLSVDATIKIGNVTGRYSLLAEQPYTLSANVSFDATDGKFADGSTMQTKASTVGGEYAFPQEPSRQGYSFDGWYTSVDGGAQVNSWDTVPDSSSRTLYAHWSVKPIAVTFDANGGTFPNGTSTQIRDQKFGDTYFLPSNPTRTGYIFNGWFTAKSGGSKVTASVSVAAASGQTLYAHWAKTVNPPNAAPVPVYRVYNHNSGLHHYTMNPSEKNALVKLGWKYEGVSFNAAKQGSVNGLKPVYREYNPYSGNHNWTLNQTEHKKLVKLGWRDEGIAWYANPAGPVTVYRLYNPYSGEHVYTTSAKEYAVVGKAGWHQEGVAWKGL
jgi:uncharacterized repeat protein (TIGR02543 family)